MSEKECAECLYSYSTSKTATTSRGGYPMCAQCAREYDAGQKSKLRKQRAKKRKTKVIARRRA